MNESPTVPDSGSELTQARSGFDLENTRRLLIAKRVAAGADSPIGHRCSNLIEMLGNLDAATDDDQRRFLTRCIESCMNDLAKLTTAPQVAGG